MMVSAELWTIARTTQGNAVMIRAADYTKVVPIFIGNLETQSLLIGLGRLDMPRPLTHDLILNFAAAMNVNFEKIEISRLENETYFADLHYRYGEEAKVIDCRPSDALSLMVRQGIPLYIESNIIETAGIEVEMIEHQGEIEPLLEGKEQNQHEMLEAKLKRYVAEERYEEAAVIRDLLNKLGEEE